MMNKKTVRNNVLKVGSKNLNTENWEVYHPNGTHMFTCGEKKAKWYLNKGLAVRSADGKITLTFEPKGYGFEADEIFGKSVREAICVVNGLDYDLQRHHIVPYCYRTFFAEQYKSKNHHDVVLINHEEHSNYEKEATKFKDEIGKKYGVKSIGELNLEYTKKLRLIGRDNAILLNTLMSLFNGYDKISGKSKREKLLRVSVLLNASYEEVCALNYIQLYKVYQLVLKEHNEIIDNFKLNKRIEFDHGYLVVKKLDTTQPVHLRKKTKVSSSKNITTLSLGVDLGACYSTAANIELQGDSCCY